MNGSRAIAFLAGCTFLLAPTSLLAQEEGPTDAASVAPSDDEDKDDKPKDEKEKKQAKKKEKKDKRLETRFLLSSEAHSMNNLDLRALDESSDQAILESDDRSTFAYTSLAGEISYDVLDTTEFEFAAAHTGLWGNDQIGGFAAPKADGPSSANFLWIYRLAATWEPIDKESLDFEMTVGRQNWELGGAEEDFFMDDTLDGVTLELDLGTAGAFRALALDFYGAN
ncbi:MAG: hypothetical protein ABEN55_06475, partial [Bradymonadaceae bacterium]